MNKQRDLRSIRARCERVSAASPIIARVSFVGYAAAATWVGIILAALYMKFLRMPCATNNFESRQGDIAVVDAYMRRRLQGVKFVVTGVLFARVRAA